mmetsp:Transcript_35641/g.77881  ORF Transcript_35641/g.77881 Transcript_35641/m.77881 type:complete len:108 (-) Transcript_35641:15-338(-)
MFFIGTCLFFITTLGTYLRPSVVTAVNMATLVGIFELFVVFETMKCVVNACIALAAEKSMEKQMEVQRRQERMASKGQALLKTKFGDKLLKSAAAIVRGADSRSRRK